MTFYGHIQRMNLDRLTGKLFNYSESSKCPICGYKTKDVEKSRLLKRTLKNAYH